MAQVYIHGSYPRPGAQQWSDRRRRPFRSSESPSCLAMYVTSLLANAVLSLSDQLAHNLLQYIHRHSLVSRGSAYYA